MISSVDLSQLGRTYCEVGVLAHVAAGDVRPLEEEQLIAGRHADVDCNGARVSHHAPGPLLRASAALSRLLLELIRLSGC